MNEPLHPQSEGTAPDTTSPPAFTKPSPVLGLVLIALTTVGGILTGLCPDLLSASVIGAIIYYMVITLVLRMGLEATDLKLLTALVVALFLSVPSLKGKLTHHSGKRGIHHAGNH